VIDKKAAIALGNLIVEEVERLPSLLAVAIFYETAQTAPALYLAYETAENCMQRLKSTLSNDSVLNYENRVGRYVGENEHFALQDRLGDRIGTIFNTGFWQDPASPVLLGYDPIVDVWATDAFQAIHDSLSALDHEVEIKVTAANAHIRATLWHAIDHARQHCKAGKWPPISFIQSVDDYSADLITCIATRGDGQ
jgi:hypothetical protein